MPFFVRIVRKSLLSLRHIAFTFAIVTCVAATALSQPTVPLHQAVEQGLVEVHAKGLGGYRGKCLEIRIKNLEPTALRIEVAPGSMFGSVDEEEQDLMITAPAQVFVQGGRSAVSQLFTMCTQSSNASPGRESRFTFRGLASAGLLALAKRIAEGNYQTSSAQSAVWVIASKESPATVYGEDPEEIRNLAAVISAVENIPLSHFSFAPRRHQIVSINASIEMLSEQDVQKGKLAMYDRAGRVLRTYFQDKFLEKGFQQFKIGASHTMDSSERFWLRLTEGSRVLAEKEITHGDTILVLPRLHQEAVLTYTLDKEQEVEIGLYDAQHRLHFLVAPNRMLKPGFHRSRVIADTPVLPEGTYFLQARSRGNLLASQEVSWAGEAPTIHPTTQIEGVFTFTLTEDLGPGKLILLDEAGRTKRILAQFERLRQGERRFTYRFEHADGPEASFTIRLVNAAGTVLAEKKL